MSDALQTFALQFLSGLTSAMFLFLLAAGLSLIFGVSRIINISHGAFYTLGAYWLVTLSAAGPLSPAVFALAAVGGALVIAALGAALEVVILRRVYKGGMLIVALVTFGLLALTEEIVKIVWGAELTAAPRPRGLDGATIVAGGAMPHYSLALVVVGLAVAGAVWLAVEKTRFGLLIRAAAADREMLSVLGADVPRVYTLTFALGAGLAGLAGVLAGPLVSISPTMGSGIIIEAFAVVVIGGLGSLAGSLLGAFIVGQAQAFGILLAPESTLVLLYVLMAVILVVRPEGLLGARQA
ncbi:MAG TPA: branched-chain amino acid ABC transporter permease [Beijerinckiaceae bacterium]|jgi:branched-chain amino acid transport system permease protein